MAKLYWVYILECDNGAFYTGYTNNLDRRYKDHCEGKAAKYTRSFKPVKIAQSWKFKEKSAAMRTEMYIKRLTQNEKLQLILNPDQLNLYITI